jgi:hypothetical protein
MKILLMYLAVITALHGRIKGTGEPVPTAEFVAATKDATSLVFLQGLPRSANGLKAAELDKPHVETVLIETDIFYVEPLPVSAEDQKTVLAAFSRDDFAVEWRGLKLCGEFHGDFALEWWAKEKRIATVLVCFGCHELKLIFGEKNVRADIPKDRFELLRTILLKYRRAVAHSAPDSESKMQSIIPPKINRPNVLPPLPKPSIDP